MDKIIRNEDMVIGFKKDKDVLSQGLFDTKEIELDYFNDIAKPMFQLTVAGEVYGFNSGLVTGQTNLPREMKLMAYEEKENNKIFKYINERLSLEVEVNINMVPNVNVMQCTTSIKNVGDKPRIITHLSSIFMTGIASGGLLSWNDSAKMKLHYCMQTWNGEGQWRTSSLEDAGLYRNSVHPNASAFHLSSTGSWSTGRFAPMLVLEDLETEKVWYLQVETSANWHIEFGFDGLGDRECGALYLQADGADEKFGGFSKVLQPDEEFCTVPVAIGCCNGGFKEAIKQLTKYRRNVLKPKSNWEGKTPLVFNDYMNCLWGSPSRENEIPLIDAAAKSGMECFCIDAGWYISRTNNNWATLGDWIPGDDRFGEGGLQYILDYIRSKGMIPGLWLEIEMCSENTDLDKKPDDWFMRRYGIRVGSGDRMPLNFANPEVRAHMHTVIDRLINMGVGFFKNDYNLCVGNGDDTNGSAALGLLENIRGFYKFIDEVRVNHPSLIIENCASGAMREDYGILSRFDLQSISDQEDYTFMPSIISGSLANVLPEQLGIWSYPYPHKFFERGDTVIYHTKEYKLSMVDGEQTVFNMVNGFLGNTYLSGRIDMADDLNFSLISEAISLSKSQREFVSNSYPIWPEGTHKIGNLKSLACMGLANEDNSRILLAVWRLSSDENCYCIHLDNFKNKDVKITQIYPTHESFNSKTSFDSLEGILKVYLEKQNTARFFEILI